MLDRAQILKELSGRLNAVYSTTSREREYAYAIWQEVADERALSDTLKRTGSYASLPRWQDALSLQHPLQKLSAYRVVAVDGSQVYPDRHQGVDCYLINLGIVDIWYGGTSRCTLRSRPIMCVGSEAATVEYQPELVDAQRTEHELRAGLACMQQAGGEPALFLIDGSLIFWHLAEAHTDVEREFLARYHEILEAFFVHTISLAAYISAPKSRDIMGVLRYVSQESGRTELFAHLVDADILALVLAPGQRTSIFESCVAGVRGYAAHTKPHFFYLNTGNEIARVELPAWLIPQVDLIASCVYDQITKGNGYPVALAEAHEAAVVTAADREFFYLAVRQLLPDRSMSQKSTHKRYKSV